MDGILAGGQCISDKFTWNQYPQLYENPWLNENKAYSW